MIYQVSRTVFWIFFKAFFNLKAVGTENLPAKGAFIVASNHASYLDPPIVGAAVHRSTRYLARENLFKKGLMGWWIRSTGCIPVKRSGRDIKSMKQALMHLKNGMPITLFPEGTRSIDGSLKKAHAGVGFLAVKARVPVVPAYVKGSKDALPKNSRSLKRVPISVYFGKRIEPDSFKNDKDPKVVYKKITREVMDAILELKRKHGG